MKIIPKVGKSVELISINLLSFCNLEKEIHTEVRLAKMKSWAYKNDEERPWMTLESSEKK